MIYPACNPQYFKDGARIGLNFNSIPMIEKLDENLVPVWELYFPRPFLISGLGQNNNIPSAGVPFWPLSDPAILSPAFQGTYINLAPALFIELARATCYEYDVNNVTQPIHYIGPGEQGTDFRGYFSRYLSDSQMLNPGHIYNIFAHPQAIFKKFWTGQAAAIEENWYPKFLDLSAKMKKITDLKLWGAPGIYRIYYSNSLTFAWQPDSSFYGQEIL